jgi:hypothetical protein
MGVVVMSQNEVWMNMRIPMSEYQDIQNQIKFLDYLYAEGVQDTPQFQIALKKFMDYKNADVA